MDLFCYFSFVFVDVILSFLFLAALWSPAGKGLNLDFLVCFCVLSLSHMVSLVAFVSNVVLDCIDS